MVRNNTDEREGCLVYTMHEHYSVGNNSLTKDIFWRNTLFVRAILKLYGKDVLQTRSKGYYKTIEKYIIYNILSEQICTFPCKFYNILTVCVLQ